MRSLPSGYGSSLSPPFCDAGRVSFHPVPVVTRPCPFLIENTDLRFAAEEDGSRRGSPLCAGILGVKGEGSEKADCAVCVCIAPDLCVKTPRL